MVSWFFLSTAFTAIPMASAQAIRGGGQRELQADLLGNIFSEFPEGLLEGPAPITGAERYWRFQFENGVVFEGNSDGVAYVNGFRNDAAMDILGKNEIEFNPGLFGQAFTLHVSCSDDFPGGYGEKGGPKPNNVGYRIVSWSIGGDKKDCGGSPGGGGGGLPAFPIELLLAEIPLFEIPLLEKPGSPAPTASPTERPTAPPTERPTPRPTAPPTTQRPTLPPTLPPTPRPTNPPTSQRPTDPPTPRPTNPPTSQRPTDPPTQRPTDPPTQRPTWSPTQRPTDGGQRL